VFTGQSSVSAIAYGPLFFLTLPLTSDPERLLRKYMALVTVEPRPNFRENHSRGRFPLAGECVCFSVKL